MNQKEYKEKLAEWAWKNECVIEYALRTAIDSLPVHMISGFERTLDELKKLRRDFK